MSRLLNVSLSPHVKTQTTMKGIMYDVATAMIPVVTHSVYQLGIKALLIILITVTTCILSEFVHQSLMGLSATISDGNALVTGLVPALNMPLEILLWIPFLSGAFAIITVKQVLDGLGQNFIDPALTARCLLLISLTGRTFIFVLDRVFGATSLTTMRTGQQVDTAAIFIRKIPETIGEMFALALLIGAAYLLIKEVISIRISGTYILTFAIFMLLFGGMDGGHVLAQAYGGGLILGALFVAVDYMAGLITVKGQIMFDILLGIPAGALRLWSGPAEGVSYAIIFCSILAPLIKKVTMSVTFGFGKGGK